MNMKKWIRFLIQFTWLRIVYYISIQDKKRTYPINQKTDFCDIILSCLRQSVKTDHNNTDKVDILDMMSSSSPRNLNQKLKQTKKSNNTLLSTQKENAC